MTDGDTKDTKNRLAEIYYQPENLWTVRKAFKELQKDSGLSKAQVLKFLGKQALWQVHLPRPRIQRPHFSVTTVNELHQFYLLMMPHDTLYGNMYKALLTGIDVKPVDTRLVGFCVPKKPQKWIC